MNVEFKVSDMELVRKANEMLKQEEYLQIREKYKNRNPRKYVTGEMHRRLMQEANDLAKTVIAKGGTEEEVRNACLYVYVCMDARKYRLNYGKARNDFGINELIRKYQSEIPAEADISST